MGTCKSRCPNGTCKAAHCTCVYLPGWPRKNPTLDAEGQARVMRRRRQLQQQKQLDALRTSRSQALEHFMTLLRALNHLSWGWLVLPAAPSSHACKCMHDGCDGSSRLHCYSCGCATCEQHIDTETSEGGEKVKVCCGCSALFIEAREWRAELQSLLLSPSTCLFGAKKGTFPAAEPRWIR